MRTTTMTGRAGTDHTRLRRLGRVPIALAVVATLGLAACGSDHDDAETAARDITVSEEADDGFFGSDAATEPAEAVERPATGGASQTGAPIDFTYGRDLIVEAGVTMLTPNVRDAVDDILDLSRANGGSVFRADVTVEDPLEDGSVPGGGTIVVRIPPDRLDQLVQDLRGVGTLRNQTQSVDDVTDQLIDLDIQIRQAFESVERMEAILAETTDFDSLVAAETELVRRQTAYERLLAAQRNLDERVALSTLTIDVRYQAPAEDGAPVDDGGDDGIGDAFRDGWDAFAGLLFGIAFVLAVGAPFIAVGLLVLFAGWLITKRLRRHQAIERNRHEPLEPLPAPRTAGEQPTGDEQPVTDELVDTTRTE